jgi:hypothetical protein
MRSGGSASGTSRRSAPTALSLLSATAVFHNVVSMTRVLQALIDEGYPVTPEIIARLSPYKTEHINRFGNYELRFDHPPPPITEELRLAPALAAS